MTLSPLTPPQWPLVPAQELASVSPDEDPSSAVEYFKALLHLRELKHQVAETQTEAAATTDEPPPPPLFPNGFPGLSGEMSSSFPELAVLPNAGWEEIQPPPMMPFNVSTDLLAGFDSIDDLNDLKHFVGTFKQNLDVINPVNPDVFWALVCIYFVLIVFGLCGNVLILVAVLGKESMRTARNVFIVTLAISDLVLCLFTMPTTLWEILYRRWPFGRDTQWLCQLANAGQATPVFMSSLSIVAVALDRYRCILQPDLTQVSVFASVLISCGMAALACVMSVPLFLGTQLRPYVSFNKTTLDDILLCSDIRDARSRAVYNLSSCFVQFILPLLIVFGVYASIYCRLRHRPQSQHEQNNRRRRRTNIMIVAISISFFLSWLPLNTLNTTLDFKPKLVEELFGKNQTLVYGLANIFGLGNACVNPLLYGCLNENFRKEYRNIYRRLPGWKWLRVCCTRRRDKAGLHAGHQGQRLELQVINALPTPAARRSNNDPSFARSESGESGEEAVGSGGCPRAPCGRREESRSSHRSTGIVEELAEEQSSVAQKRKLNNNCRKYLLRNDGGSADYTFFQIPAPPLMDRLDQLHHGSSCESLPEAERARFITGERQKHDEDVTARQRKQCLP